MTRWRFIDGHYIGTPPLEMTFGTYVSPIPFIPLEDEVTDEMPAQRYWVSINGNVTFDMPAVSSEAVITALQTSSAKGTMIPGSSPPTYIINWSSVYALVIDPVVPGPPPPVQADE